MDRYTLVTWKQECKNQAVHMYLGMTVSLFAALIGGGIWPFVLPAALGLIVEIAQYFTVDDRRISLLGRLLDLSIWTLSGIQACLLFHLIKY